MSENLNLEVENVLINDKPATRVYTQNIKKFDRLGKEIKVSPKSHVCINNPGHKIEFFVETISVNIGIGNDFTADLIMTKEAWEALNKGEKIHITTNKEFKQKYL